jgi:hypothetical protein
MVAVVTPGMNARMWLPAAHFASGTMRLPRPPQPIFQTTSLVAAEGFVAHGR